MPKDPLEEALDELIAEAKWYAICEDNRLPGYKPKPETKLEELKRHILAHARWIGDDEDCTCTPDGDACGYCSNKYQLDRERTKE